MWRRRVAGFGVLLVCVLVGCSDAPTGDASGIGEVVNGETRELESELMDWVEEAPVEGGEVGTYNIGAQPQPSHRTNPG